MKPKPTTETITRERPPEIANMADPIPIHCAHDRMADVTAIVPHPRNPNKHGDKQVALLAKIIRHQGWRSPIVVSKRSGFVIAGHGRLQAALLLGLQSVPVNDQDFTTEADEWAHLVADNRIAELAEMDPDGLRSLVIDLGEVDGFDLDLTGFDADSAGELLNAAEATANEDTSQTLAERFGVPPFSVLDARQGYWQDRKRAWLCLGIQSELGRGGGMGWMPPTVTQNKDGTLNYNGTEGQSSRFDAQTRGGHHPAAARVRRATIASVSVETEKGNQ